MSDVTKEKLPEVFKGRSLGEAVRFAASDITGFRKTTQKEAESIIGNCNTAIVMKSRELE